MCAVLRRVVCACPPSMRIGMRPAKALLAQTNVKAEMRRNGTVSKTPWQDTPCIHRAGVHVTVRLKALPMYDVSSDTPHPHHIPNPTNLTPRPCINIPLDPPLSVLIRRCDNSTGYADKMLGQTRQIQPKTSERAHVSMQCNARHLASAESSASSSALWHLHVALYRGMRQTWQQRPVLHG